MNVRSLILQGPCVRLLGAGYADQYVDLWRGGSGMEEKIKEDRGQKW